MKSRILKIIATSVSFVTLTQAYTNEISNDELYVTHAELIELIQLWGLEANSKMLLSDDTWKKYITSGKIKTATLGEKKITDYPLSEFIALVRPINQLRKTMSSAKSSDNDGDLKGEINNLKIEIEKLRTELNSLKTSQVDEQELKDEVDILKDMVEHLKTYKEPAKKIVKQRITEHADLIKKNANIFDSFFD